MKIKFCILIIVILSHIGSNNVFAQWSSITNNNIWNLNTGNVGIGTTTPRGVLEVFGNNKTPKIALRYTGTTQSATNYIQSDTDGHYMEFGTYGTGVTTQIFGSSIAGSTSILMAPKITGNGIIGTTTASPLIFGTNNLERMRINSDGNIGFGCNPGTVTFKIYKPDLPNFELASSQSRLQIGIATCNSCFANGAILGDAVIRTLGQTNNTLLSMPNDYNDGNSYIGINDEANGVWCKFLNNRMVRVNGTIFANEINVQSDVWADNVFDSNYQLKTLDQLESYIKVNKHLPDIPTSDEVKGNGINIAKMNVLLLQKVEELTLLMIEQNKTIGDLKNKINELEK